MPSKTLLLTRSELRTCVHLPALVEELRAALAAEPAEQEQPQRVRAEPAPSVTAMVLLPGTAAGVPAYTVKVHAKNPERRPALTGVICLHDLDTGDLLAVLDSGWLTALRTGIGSAAIVTAWASSFCDGWEHVRPDPAWPIPALPREA